MKKIFTIFMFMCSGLFVMAETADSTKWRPVFGLNYMGDLHTDFKKAKFVNALWLSAELPITRKLSFDISTVTIAATDNEPLLYNILGYSSVDAETTPLALAVTGLDWQINDKHRLFFGIRNMDEDYFNNDTYALFTNSSCGNFPTLGNNFDIASYPTAALGIHYAFDSERWGAQASLYNGAGNKDFTGRDNVFRFCPKSDGVMGLAQVEHKWKDSHYYLGTSLHSGDNFNSTIWAYIDQKIGSQWSILAAYSHAFGEDALCNNFAGVGAKFDWKCLETGIFSEYAHEDGVDEWATEFSCRVNCGKYFSVQPAVHVITSGGKTSCVGLVRLAVSL